MNTREAILSVMSDKFKGIPGLATVESVSGSTCTVIRLDTEAEVLSVRLQCEDSNGLLIVPAVGSIVFILPINDFEFVVAMYSQVDHIKMLDGSYGGLTKTQELKTQLDKTNEVVQALVTSLTTWVPVPGDGGGALKTFATSQLSGKSVGDYTNIENPKITHGNS